MPLMWTAAMSPAFSSGRTASARRVWLFTVLAAVQRPKSLSAPASHCREPCDTYLPISLILNSKRRIAKIVVLKKNLSRQPSRSKGKVIYAQNHPRNSVFDVDRGHSLSGPGAGLQQSRDQSTESLRDGLHAGGPGRQHWRFRR